MSREFYAAERRIEPILAAGRAYDFEQTPANFYATPPELRLTTNCKDTAHEALRHLRGAVLAREMQITEAYFDPETPRSLFRRVQPTEEPRIGDWIMLGRAGQPRQFTPRFDITGTLLNWSEFAVNHVAVYLGQLRGKRMVLHAAPEADGAAIESLDKVRASSRTGVIHDILRAKSE